MSHAVQPQTEAAAAREHPHPGAGEYLRVATVLAVLTAVEVAVFYLPAMRTWLVPVLLSLSAIKFVLVVLFYMHLKFDHPMFSWLFVLGLTIAAALMISLMLLFGAFQRFHQIPG
jgi:cytochrome c oxidase subunit 4